MTIRALFLSLLALAPFVAVAHEVPCPVCGLNVVQNTKQADNEVVLRFGRKKIEYRCVYCALADAGKYDGDLIVYAPSETRGKPVLLQRAGGKWSVVRQEDGKLVPAEGAVFLNDFKRHAVCAGRSRAFHSREAFDQYTGGKATPLTLEQMLAASAGGGS